MALKEMVMTKVRVPLRNLDILYNDVDEKSKAKISLLVTGK